MHVPIAVWAIVVVALGFSSVGWAETSHEKGRAIVE